MIVCMCMYLHIYFSSSFLQSASSNWFIYNMAGFLLSHPKGTQEHSTSNILCSAKIKRNSHFIYLMFLYISFHHIGFWSALHLKNKIKENPVQRFTRLFLQVFSFPTYSYSFFYVHGIWFCLLCYFFFALVSKKLSSYFKQNMELATRELSPTRREKIKWIILNKIIRKKLTGSPISIFLIVR